MWQNAVDELAAMRLNQSQLLRHKRGAQAWGGSSAPGLNIFPVTGAINAFQRTSKRLAMRTGRLVQEALALPPDAPFFRQFRACFIFVSKPHLVDAAAQVTLLA